MSLVESRHLMLEGDQVGIFSTVRVDVGATRFPQYAKRMQLDWGVSEDGGLVVLIHKQRVVLVSCK